MLKKKQKKLKLQQFFLSIRELLQHVEKWNYFPPEKFLCQKIQHFFLPKQVLDSGCFVLRFFTLQLNLIENENPPAGFYQKSRNFKIEETKVHKYCLFQWMRITIIASKSVVLAEFRFFTFFTCTILLCVYWNKRSLCTTRWGYDFSKQTNTRLRQQNNYIVAQMNGSNVVCSFVVNSWNF